MTHLYVRVDLNGRAMGTPMLPIEVVRVAIEDLLHDAEDIVRYQHDKSYMFEVRKYTEMLRLLETEPKERHG